MTTSTILTYHSICDDENAPIAPYAVTPRQFAGQLDLLDRFDVPIVSMDQFFAARTGGPSLPDHSVLLTFDDGFRDNLDAFDTLHRRGLPAALFVSTGLIDGEQTPYNRLGEMLRPTDLNEIESLGVVIGSHGHDHLELDTAGRHRAERDIVRSRDALAALLGRPVEQFAYPYGYNSAIVRWLVQDAGFGAAFAVGNRMVTDEDSRWSIPRILVRGDTSAAQFTQWITGNASINRRRHPILESGWRLVRRSRRVVSQLRTDHSPTHEQLETAELSAAGVRDPHHIVIVDLDTGTVRRRPSATATADIGGAMCLARRDGYPVGLITIRGEAARTDAGLLTATRSNVVEPSGTGTRSRWAADLPAVTVVVASRDRAEKLAESVPGLLALDYPELEVIVVDNAPTSSATRDLVEQVAGTDRRLRYACEPIPGLSRARNCGLDLARTPLVSFVDDDIDTERDYLRWLCSPFVGRPDVWCVSGMVLPAELETAAQWLFEEFGGFSAGLERREYRIDMRPKPSALFPYSPGLLGTGGCLAFRTTRLRSLGGFDPYLGAGTLARGGEDLDITMRVVRRGGTLVYEPGAVVWHHHHREIHALRSQIANYGAGLGAAFTKLVIQPTTTLGVLRRLPSGIAMLMPSSEKNANRSPAYPRSLVVKELQGLSVGWIGYLRSVAQALKPLTEEPSGRQR